MQALPDSSIKRIVAEEFLQCVLKLVEDFFRETEALPVSKGPVVLERTFLEKRSTGVLYMSVKNFGKSWFSIKAKVFLLLQ